MILSYSSQKKRITILGIVALTLFILAYFPMFKILFTNWAEKEEYSHAFLTLPIIIYMVWRKRELFVENPGHYSSLGLILLVLTIPFYLFALVTNVNTVIALSMFMTIIGAMIYLAGVQTIKELAAPLLLLAMLVPFPNQLYIQITFPLQLKVSQISEFFVRLSGIPILREGNVMHIPIKSFEVVEACSGLRSVFALMTMSVIMGYFFLKRTPSKFILIASSVPTAIFVNIIRVTLMIILFHFYRVDLYEGSMHTVTGLFIFAIALVTLFLVQRALELWEKRSN